MDSDQASTAPVSLQQRLRQALPSTFSCKIRYIHSPPVPCEPLFSPLPGHDPERTRLTSHFLTVNIDPASLGTSTDVPCNRTTKDVMGFAVEVLLYTSRRLSTIFISKVDSTSYIPRVKPSPIKTTITAFLSWLFDEENRRQPTRKVVISLFARAQAQYLFPGSSDDKAKHVLNDRQLIKWWARILDPIIPSAIPDPEGMVTETAASYQAYITVPGCTGSELRSFMPPANTTSGTQPRWLPGNPLIELAKTRGLPEHAPPRCLLPRFPDDPKARFMSDLDEEIGIAQEAQVTISPSKKKSGRWKSAQTLDQFWEMMEFRQECMSGRAVGFLWLVISPRGSDSDHLLATQTSFSANMGSQESNLSLKLPSTNDRLVITPPTLRQDVSGSPKKKSRRKPLTGLIVPRQPKLKGGSSSASNLSEMQARLNGSAGDGIVVTKEGYDKAMHTLLNLDFSNLQIAARSTSKWVAEVVGIAGLDGDFAVTVTGEAEADVSCISTTVTNGTGSVNDLGGMVRKKRKAGEGEAQQPVPKSEKPVVNVLTAGMIRKKAKPASNS